MKRLFALTILAIIVCTYCYPCFAEEKTQPFSPFEGEIKGEHVNIRSDSTTSSEIICTLIRTDPVSVVSQSYDWYKIKLPKSAPSYIKKTLVAVIDDKTIKVIKDNVNIRLKPDELSAILGKVNKDEILHVIKSEGDWFQIEPVANSFGWVNKKLINEFRTGLKIARPQEPKEEQKDEPQVNSKGILEIEGTVEPYGKVLRRIATHKLLVKSNSEEPTTYLLKGKKASLNALNYRRVRISGKLLSPEINQKLPIIEIIKMELLD